MTPSKRNSESTRNENKSLLTVLQTVKSGHPDTRQMQSEQTSQRAAPNHDETKPTKQPRLNARISINVERDDVSNNIDVCHDLDYQLVNTNL
jgi:hypothetical protein